MSKSIENELRRRSKAMYEASKPVESLVPRGFEEDYPNDGTEVMVLVGNRERRRQASGWLVAVGVAAVVLLVAIPLILLTGKDLSPPAETDGVVVQTLYADGDVRDCPNHLADDTGTPVGHVTYTPSSGGTQMRVVLTDAAPNWTYVVHIFKELQPPYEECAVGLETVSGLVTDEHGEGELTHFLALPPGNHRIGVNVAYDIIDPPDPHHDSRENAPDDYADITVPTAGQ